MIAWWMACSEPTTTEVPATTGTAPAADPCPDPGEFPADTEILDNADGPAELTLFDIGWVYYGTDTTEVPQWEAARFELPHPAQIVGFDVMWTNLGPKLGDEDLVEAGLYPDFGYNGFDFDAPNPYATSARCAGDIVDGVTTTHALGEPVTIDHPGLVYVAHLKKKPKDPVWWMDGTITDAYCATFDACRAAWNFPELDANYYNGVSVILPYDYKVRLHVRWLDDRAPEDASFQPVPGPSFGSRTSWGDYDNDGWDDVVASGLQLWRNEGGSLVNVTAGSGLEFAPAGGAVWGDYDGDGCPDLFGFNEGYSGPEYLLRGDCNGHFTDETAASGITDATTDTFCTEDPYETAATAAAGWLDLDADGLLDLYLANMICWDTFKPYDDRVWHNLGDGLFEDWSGTRGFDGDDDKSGRGAAPVDADQDGDVDLLINNYTLYANMYYENQGDGTVIERAEEAGLAGDESEGYFGHTIGSAWGDLDGDLDFDAVHANLAHPRFYDFSDRTKVLLNEGGGFWSDASESAGLRYQETHSVPSLADFDLDGDLDMVITAVYDGRPTDYYWGEGDGTFRLDTYTTGITTENGWGASTADVDHDGDPDLATYELFRNDAATGRWFQVRVVGDAGANTMGLGATVVIDTPGGSWLRHVSGGNGQGGQDAATLIYGLGDVDTVDAVHITWPGGSETHVTGPWAADARLWVTQSGVATVGWTR